MPTIDSTGTTTTTLPAYSEPYITDMLGRGQALGNAPYQAYQGQRVAGLNDMQTGSNNSLYGLNAGATIEHGQNLLGAAGAYQPGQQQFGLAAAQQYMNPYQQGVTDIAKQEAVRQSDIQQNSNDARAAQSGAFGGSRQGVMDAEAQRNLQQNLSNIQVQGANTAYNNAQQQFNADANRNQQDAQYGNSASLSAGTALSHQGTSDYGLQQTAGMQQQQNDQNKLDIGYQNFTQQQQHPYDQLNFMHNLVSGFPGSSSTTVSNTNTADSSSNASNWGTAATVLGGLGTAFGWKGGGEVKAGLGHGRVAQLYGSLK